MGAAFRRRKMSDKQKISFAQQRIMSLRDQALVRAKSGEQSEVLTKLISSGKVINMMSKRVHVVTPADRAEMVRLARDPSIRRD
ncbi:hypothetical protein hmeg3_02080 [Herbaspirillum sp. meg3]|nr:hypothetical protein hmeg3_02080 [Herbaspirillum sp. meg3]